jgi:peptidylprolyl isomerase
MNARRASPVSAHTAPARVRGRRPGSVGVLCVVGALWGPTAIALTSSTPQAQPAPLIVVVETSKGTFAFETFPIEAPKTVAHVVELVRQGFYDGQRIHRAVPAFVVQWGDPRSRDLTRQSEWGRGAGASSGTPVGVAEITKKRVHTAGAVALAHPGLPSQGDSQVYVTLADRPDLNGKYTVFGHVIEGADVPPRLERGDFVTRMYVRE